ncbi:MAG TPA: hypothetical protein VMM27_09995 [Casimicrobiaceae bacterium]|nr:hypothetical protein [Casimicrobiaceae bacterium]
MRVRVCLFVALASAFEAFAMTPPKSTHFFYDLLVVKGDVLIATHSDGIYRTDQAIPPYRQIADLYVDARGTLYANTIRLLPKLLESEERIYASPDAGVTWVEIDFGISGAKPPQFAMRAVRSNALYFSSRFYTAKRWTQPALCRSTDARSLEKVDGSKLRGVVGANLLIGPAEELFVLDRYDIHRSDDHGKSWRTLGKNGLPGPVSPVAR